MNSSSDAWYEVTTDAQATWLSDPLKRRFLLPFLGRERSIKDASEEAGCTLEVMYYRVQQLQVVGLLKIAYEAARGGRAIKHYRTVADRFFVPYALMPFGSLEDELLLQWQEPLRHLSHGVARIMRQHAYEGQYLSRLPNGETNYAGGPAPHPLPDPLRPSPLALDILGELYLSRDEARAFRQGLVQLFRAFNGLSTDTAERYTYALIFAPGE